MKKQALQPAKNSLLRWSIFVIVILAAGFLRFYNIQNRGLIRHDEGYYSNSAKTPYYVLKWFSKDKNLHEKTNLKDYLQSYGCSNPKDKPGHILLLSVGFLIFGMKEVSPLLISAILGISSVFWIYLFGRKRLGFTWSIFSMAILAVSYLHIYYSRSALYISSVFFSFLALHLYIWSIETKPLNQLKWMGLVGLVIAFCVSIDQKIIFFAACLVLTDVYTILVRGKKSFLLFLKRLMAYSGLFLIFTLFVDAIFKILYRHYGLSSEYPAYINYFFRSKVYAISDSYTWDFSDFLFYPKIIFSVEGIIFFVSVSFGMALFIRALRTEKQPLYVFCVLLWLLTLGFWTFRSGGHPSIKVILALLPTGAIMAGFAIKQLYEFLCRKIESPVLQRLILVLVLCCILTSGMVNAIPLLKLRNVYGIAVSNIALRLKQSGGHVLTFAQGSFSPLARFYFGLEIEKDRLLAEHVVFDEKSNKRNKYFFATWHSYGKEGSLKKILEHAEKGKEVLRLYDTSVSGLPPVMYLLRGGLVLKNYPLLMGKYEDFEKVVVYEVLDTSLTAGG